MKKSLASFTHTQNSLSRCKEKFSGKLHTHPKLPIPLSLSLSLSLSLCVSVQGKNSLMSFTRTQNSQCLSLSLQGKFFTMSTKTSNPLKNWNLLTLQSIVDASLTNPYNISQHKSLPLSVQKTLLLLLLLLLLFCFCLLEIATVTSTKLSVTTKTKKETTTLLSNLQLFQLSNKQTKKKGQIYFEFHTSHSQ